ncbi:hypothetical protein PENTCL1PPCAC_29746 [Pristionchus entomophagus]|uniref:Uncharacterized protein n=1 Tax=Pristionchus entomophagus TaxID=358040 RepID=A0AAV5UMQ6_9BILA|nr:hypothetical protein PENTCL1PPCAC_29746 [Pristionchus entomophagus]
MSRLSSVLLLALCIAVAVSLDCRKFSFAPACRGLLLKRASAPQEFELATKTCTTPSDVLAKVIEAAELAGYGEVVDMAFLRTLYNKAYTETIAIQRNTKA